MCLPEIGFGLGIAQSAGGYFQAVGAANAAAEYKNAIFKQNQELALDSAYNQYGILTQREIEEGRQAAQEITAIASQATQARATGVAIAGQAGVKGASLDALTADFTRQQLTYQHAVQQEQAFKALQFRAQGEAIQNQTAGRILSQAPTPTGQPSIFNAITGGLGGAFRNYQRAGGTFGEPDDTPGGGGLLIPEAPTGQTRTLTHPDGTLYQI